MLRLLSTFTAPVALVLIGLLLLEPPALTPGDRIPTLRIFTGGGAPNTSGQVTPVSDLAPYLGRWRLDLDAIAQTDSDIEPYVVTIERRSLKVWVHVTSADAEVGSTKSEATLGENTLVTIVTRRRAGGIPERVLTRYRVMGNTMEMEQTVSSLSETVTTSLPLARITCDE